MPGTSAFQLTGISGVREVSLALGGAATVRTAARVRTATEPVRTSAAAAELLGVAVKRHEYVPSGIRAPAVSRPFHDTAMRLAAVPPVRCRTVFPVADFTSRLHAAGAVRSHC